MNLPNFTGILWNVNNIKSNPHYKNYVVKLDNKSASSP